MGADWDLSEEISALLERARRTDAEDARLAAARRACNDQGGTDRH